MGVRARRQRGQVAIFALIAVPAFMILLAMVVDAATIAIMRAEASAVASSFARYVALDATQVGCHVGQEPVCDNVDSNGEWIRNRECSAPNGSVPAGFRYFDDQIIDGYNVGSNIAALYSRDRFGDLVGRLPSGVNLDTVTAHRAPAAQGSSQRVEVTVQLLRPIEEMLTPRLLVGLGGGSRGAVAEGTAEATVYVSEPNSVVEAAVRYWCP